MLQVNTPLSPSRLIFAALCALGILVIGYGAALEISRQKRGVTLVSPRQYRVRLISAAVWIVILLSMTYTVTYLWPVTTYTADGRLSAESKEAARTFLFALFGSFVLMISGLVLFFVDLRHTTHERQALESKRQQDFAELTAGLRAARTAASAGAPGPGADEPDTPCGPEGAGAHSGGFQSGGSHGGGAGSSAPDATVPVTPESSRPGG